MQDVIALIAKCSYSVFGGHVFILCLFSPAALAGLFLLWVLTTVGHPYHTCKHDEQTTHRRLDRASH